MTRKSELLHIFEELDKDILTIVTPLIDDLVHIEEELSKLRKLPFIKIHPSNPEMQKTTPAARLYKDFLSQEKEIVRLLCSYIHKGDAGESESELRLYFKELNKHGGY